MRQITSNNSMRMYLKVSVIMALLIVPLTLMQQYIVEKQLEISFWAIPTLVIVLMVVVGGQLLKVLEWQKSESQLFKALTDFSLEFTYIRSVEGEYQYVSPAAEDITGYSEQYFYDKPNFMDSLIVEEDLEAWQCHVHLMNEDSAPERVEFRIRDKKGEIRWIEHLCGPVHDKHGNLVAVRSVNVDITEQKQAMSKLERMGFYDPLTNLPNRRYLNQHLKKLIHKIEQEDSDKKFAVIFIDLVNFKYVNDAHGHSIGDRLLQMVAKRFNNSCLDCEQAIISRFGGDEFVLVNQMSTTTESIQSCVKRINQLLEKPFKVHGYRVNIGASCGVSMYPDDGLTPELLIKNADAAMFQAKSQSLNMAFFSPEMATHATEMVTIQAKLRKAIQRGEIQPYYQPLIDLQSGKIMGVEVLARWIDMNGEPSPSPAVFIPISEETGLIWALSETMIEQAGQQILKWQSQGLKLSYSINVSARQFSDENFCDNAIAQFKQMGIDPTHVQIELTESVLMDNIHRSIDKIEYLRSQGFKIALDDFGTGFASLQYLTMYPLDTLKIDRTFVMDMLEDSRKLAIAKSIINLAKDLNLKVVAEGIETDEQKSVLMELGCDIGQGFLFSRPVCKENLTELMELQEAA
ncbi:putative bifunctional diguanylate cyclase/phosphodiesterase [Thiomicrorhabdus indica]|uniref:putative bifunctional diguanylate cyclase/phosphodiesterase n=1 Tax=Thiomicrorhabdus indica TaxID=2267253 RepID=UPI00102DC0FE|nr:GGDEF domain-containing phosphodiesterase [Thiomicrorhabdus indica]